MNQVRNLLLERGNIVPPARARLAVRLGEMLEAEEPGLGTRINRLVAEMRTRWAVLDVRIADLGAEFADATRSDARTRPCASSCAH